MDGTGRIRVEAVRSIVERTAAAMGYEVVDIEMGQRGLLRVFIDAPAGIRMEDCERVSRQLSHVFTVEEVDYQRLEVSSPGLDRPLKRESDFVRFAGELATVKLKSALEGRRNFEGTLTVEPEGRFGLVLTDPSARAAKGAAAGKAAGRGDGKQADKQADKQAGTKRKAGEQPAARKLVFALDEIDRARLVPKVKF